MKTYTDQFAQLVVNAENAVKSFAIDEVIKLPKEMNIYFYGEYNFINKSKLTLNDLHTIMPESLFRVADILVENK